MTLPESKPSDTEKSKTETTSLSARLGAESALNEFQHKMVDQMTDQQAKDAYARLMVGRGFDRPRPAPGPVMTIHSAIVSGNAEAESPADNAKVGAAPQVGLRAFLRRLMNRLGEQD